MQNRNDTSKFFTLLLASLFAIHQTVAQGTFQNLNFESANVSGATKGDQISVASGMPGWSVSGSLLYYDVIADSSPVIGINDQNTGLGFEPLQGNFSAYLAGGEGSAVSISQSGLVPTGTKSLRVDIQTLGFNLQVSLGGETISMVPLQATSTYTVYGGNVSAFAGMTEQMAFTEPNTPGLGIATIDDIVFSSSSIPEPDTWTLLLFGAGLLGVARYAKSKRYI